MKDKNAMTRKTNNKIRLLVTASTFPRYDGDTEPRFVLDLAKELNKVFDVTVLAPMAPEALEYEELEGIKVIRYHYFPIRKWETLCYPGAIIPRIKEKKIRFFLVPFLFIGLYVKLRRIVKQFDAVHAHWIIPQGMVQSLIKKPYLVTGHGGDITSLNAGIMKKIKYRVLKKASAVTVVSDTMKTELIGRYKEKPQFQRELEAKVQVLSMGCNLDYFGEKYRKENYWGQGDRKVILFVGRLTEIKGVKFLISAMKSVEAILVIVGTGPLEEDLKIMAEELGINSKVIFEGAKTHEELKEIYASADIFAMTSVTIADGEKEGLGLVALEAMASGLPVVAFRSGGIVNIINHEENGLLASPGDAEELAGCINRMMNERELYEKVRKNANRSIKEYDYQYIGTQYAAIIDGMIGKQNDD